MSSSFWLYLIIPSGWVALALAAILAKKPLREKFGTWLKKQVDTDPSYQAPQVIGVAALSALVTYAFLTMLSFGASVCFISASIAFILCPSIWIKRRASKYREAYDLSLQEGLNTIASSLKAGLTLKDSLAVAAENCPAPFSTEAQVVLKQYHFGVPLEEALDELRRRVKTSNNNLAIGALIVGNQLGGNLPSILLRISHTIRERNRVEGKLQALTAQGRTQAFLLCGAPPVVGLGMYFWDPRKMELLTQTTEGQVLLGLAIVLELVGIFVTRRILDLDI